MVAAGPPIQGKLVPELERLLVLWRQRYGARALPDRPHLTPRDLESWREYAAWIERGESESLHIRRFGLELVRRFGRQALGETVNDLALDIAISIRGIVDRAIITAAPATGRAEVQFGRHAALFSDLALPLAAMNGQVSLVLFASYEIPTPRL